jgi:hypothetical protein
MRKIILSLLMLFITIINAAPLGNYFTYQGELVVNGQPANSYYDISVNLYNNENGGSSLGGNLFSNHYIVNGLFSIEIDIGSTPFIGDEVWIELSIKQAGAGSYTNLPRQRITNSPYAIHAQFVGSSGVNSDAIQSAAVTNFKLADNAVTQNKIQSSSVGTLQIINASITNSKLADNAIDSSKILDNSIISNDIADGTIIANDIATNAINSSKIQDGSITAIDINTNSVQQRISGTCPTGESIRAISNTGGVTCEPDDIGTLGWGLSGNTGTDSTANFIGTNDNNSLILKVNNHKAIQIIPTTNNDPNLIFGNENNSITPSHFVTGSAISAGTGNQIYSNISGQEGVVISGGKDNKIITPTSNPISIEFSTISGGWDNEINNSSRSIITGGYDNSINDSFNSSILGGNSNIAKGMWSTVVGGALNYSGGNYSLVAGNNAHIRDKTEVGGGDTDGDENTFIWSQSGMVSTAPKQVLFEAQGGFGIGTNAPTSPLHIKGQGTSTGSIPGSNEVVMIVEPTDSAGDVAMVINKPSSTTSAAVVFSLNGAADFDIRTSSTRSEYLEFNHYATGGKITMMAFDYFNDYTLREIEMTANIIPTIDNLFNLGTSNLRWQTIYAQNPLNTPSDKRLKKDIKDIGYGLAEILEMRPVTYHWKKGDTKRENLGLIAQEVETIVPEIVSKSDDDLQTRSMRYAELIPVLIKATQEQQILIKQQNNKIVKLELVVKKLLNLQSNK